MSEIAKGDRFYREREDDGPGRVRLHQEQYQRPGISEWSCGHIAGSVCAECYRRLAAKANELAEEVATLREEIAEWRGRVLDRPVKE